MKIIELIFSVILGASAAVLTENVLSTIALILLVWSAIILSGEYKKY